MSDEAARGEFLGTSSPPRWRQGWAVHRAGGSASELHGLDLFAPVDLEVSPRSVHFFGVDRSAVVLGSTQYPGSIDRGRARELGIDVAVRRSGGGAVLLVPSEHVWVDVVLARHDPLWTDDVSASALWLGTLWVDVPSSLGLGAAVVHGGPMQGRALGRHACFAGLAPGEVVVGSSKVVGISQRRTREWARFQCVVLRRWQVEPLVSLLAPRLDVAEQRLLRAMDVATCDREIGEIEEAVLSHLPI